MKMLHKLLITLYATTVVLGKPTKILDLDNYFDTLDNIDNDDKGHERIIGGEEVPLNEYVPYQVSVQYTRDKHSRHFCGGSILTSNRILTAAHCVKGQNVTYLTVLAGVRDLRDTTGQRVKVEKYVIHEKFQLFLGNDLAIIFINPSLQLDGKRTQTILYNDTQIIDDKQMVNLTGWGSVHLIGTGILARYPHTLQRISYTTITNAECRKTWDQVSDNDLCAIEGFGKGACNGDSGGPLVLLDGDRLKQVGVVSYGSHICGSKNPDVYTRISQFADWITKLL